MSSRPQTQDSARPDINGFVLANGRLPHLGDEIPPWLYRGWLLYLVEIADAHPKASGRWGHYMRTLEAGRLLEEPIPQIQFRSTPGTQGVKMLENCLSLIERRDSSWSSFQRLVEWLAWGLAVSKEMPPLDPATHEALYRTFNLEPLLIDPHDYLGFMLANRKSKGWNVHGFFPTPHTVCEFMTLLTLGSSGDGKSGGPPDPRLAKILDPCLGSGRLLLHASGMSYCLYGCDIDPLVASIARINACWYAPWMAFPLSESLLGIPLPAPPPAPLPIPKENKPAGDAPMFRCDDRGQGLLFD